MDRAAAQKAFCVIVAFRSAKGRAFAERKPTMCRGVIEPGALYEAPFTGLHAGGPEGLFAGNSDIISGIFQAIEETQPVLQLSAG
jgi:type I restriction enzyme R subunit